MLFNSWEFLILLVITFVLHYLPMAGKAARVWQVLVLLVASALFYGWENPDLLYLLFGSCVINGIAVERILHWKNPVRGELNANVRRARYWLVGTVSLNLAFLVFFKYAGFLCNLVPQGILPATWLDWVRTIPLPVGISFYTFQGLSLVVDVWRRDISPETEQRLGRTGVGRVASITDLSFYISFFPQLVAGPIVKAHEFVDQIGVKKARDIPWKTVTRCLITGYFLKIFVADNLAEQTAVLTLGPAHLAGNDPINLLSLLYGYSLQIFADFGGYSLIAIGLGALFGYTFLENFKFPYIATSITEFWRRWHISLSGWLRDYLYIPLGGNRKGPVRTYINLFLVMFLGGLWHGAEWKFALWGSLHGVFLALERYFGGRAKRRRATQYPDQLTCPVPSRMGVLTRATLSWFVTFHLVTLLWLTFLMPDMASIGAFFQGLVSGKTGFSGPPIFSLLFYGSAVVLYHMWGWAQEHRGQLAQRLVNPWVEGIIHGLMVFLIVTNPGAPRGFIYFQF